MMQETEEGKQRKKCMSIEKRRANLQPLLTFEAYLPEAIFSAGIESNIGIA